MKNAVGRTGQAVEQGFSLIELLIAMVVTLIVCGGVMSLLIEGNRAFQTHPDMTERQQNTRAAMDTIMRDIANAGAGLPQIVNLATGTRAAQVFTRGLSATARHTAPDGTQSDELEMLTNDTGLDPVPACMTGGVNVRLQPTAVPPLEQSTVMLLMDDGTYSLRNVVSTDSDSGGGDQCDTGRHSRLNFRSGAGDLSGRNPPGGACGLDNFGMGTNTQGTGACKVVSVVYLNVVRYYITADPDDPVRNPPVLWRQSGAGRQIVARGIEDMKVTYRSGADITANSGATQTGCPSSGICPLPLTEPADLAAATTPADAYDATTVEVQVELASRGSLYDAPGRRATKAMMMSEADGSRAYRGRLVSRGTPRAALYPLTAAVHVSEIQRWK